MARVRIVGVASLLLGALLGATTPSFGDPPHHHARHQVTPCSRGLVALTFDDGPSATVTPRLVRVLKRLDVPATFFMVGQRIASAPEAARLVADSGFTIGNHTWAHTDLTTQTTAEIHEAMRSTRREMLDAGLGSTHLMRPPYGALDEAARTEIQREGYVPVLWTIDTRDWTGLRPPDIESRVLDGVKMHATNIVLQHDGVTNSPATVRALPGEVHTLRRRGYCFAELDDQGHPTPPVPTATVTQVTPRVVEGGQAEVTVRLDQPTSRPTSVAVVTKDLNSSPSDFGWTSRRVLFGVGERVAKVSLHVRDDDLDEPLEGVIIRVAHGHGVFALPMDMGTFDIVDTDGPPAVSVNGGAITSSNVIAVGTPVTVRLDHPSGRVVRVRIRTHRESAGSDDYVPIDAWVTLPAGTRVAEIPVSVLPGPVDEKAETVRVDVLDVRHAVLRGSGVASLTIRPATTRIAPRMTSPGPEWF